jgi:hypothetical protein
MAIVVARLLARVESMDIPAPAPAPPLTPEDLASIQRLINEFRPELTALGVRVAAMEEELSAIKARLDNVRITGRYRFRYDGGPSASGPSLNGNENTGSVDSGVGPFVFRPRLGGKLMFDGAAAPNIHAILGLELGTGVTSTPATFNSAGIGLADGSCTSTPCYNFGNIAELYLDWNHAWGLPLRIQLGRMGGIANSFGMLPLQFGPQGLLLNTGSDTYGASNGNSGALTWDGLRLSGRVPSWADLTWQAAVWRVLGPDGAAAYFLGEDAYGIDADVLVVRGLRAGGYYVTNQINPASPVFPSNADSALWHVYGNPNTPLTNPPTAHCPAVPDGTLPPDAGGGTSQGGIECPALGSGAGAYVTWDAGPGLQFDGEAAVWNDAVNGTSDGAYFVDAVLDVGMLTGFGHHLALTLSYEYAGVNFYAPYQSDVDSDISGSVGPGNAQILTADLSFDLTGQWGVLAAYATGGNLSNGMGIEEYRFGVVYRFAPGVRLYTHVENQQLNGVSQYTLYRSELNYTF